MADNPYPIPRQLRASGVLVGSNVDTYGPFDFEIFDTEDVLVFVQAQGDVQFSRAADIVVSKVNGNNVLNPLDHFTVKFPAPVPPTTKYVVVSSRLAVRAVGVMSGTKISSNALEKEFSKLATQQQELRRDLDRAWKSDLGEDGLTLDTNVEDGDTLMVMGGRLVKGPNALKILEAEQFSEVAQQMRDEARDFRDEAFAAAASVDLPIIGAGDKGKVLSVKSDLSGLEFSEASSHLTVASLAALKALPVDATLAYLVVTGREGWWRLRAGAVPYADPTEGMFAQSTTSGFYWERVYDGLSVSTRWFGGDWQAAIDLCSAIAAKQVVASGTFTLTGGASLKMRPGVTLIDPSGLAVLTQANGSNSAHILDFAAHGAAGATVDGITINGNRVNNTAVIGNSHSLVLIYDTNDVTVRKCALVNGTGNGVIIRNAVRYKITDNMIYNLLINGINALRSVYGGNVHGLISGNNISEHGQHGIVVAYSDFVKVLGNRIQSTMTRTGLNVETVGNNVGSLSGNFFSPADIGRFIVLGGGYEFLITGYNSPTSIVVSPAPGTNANLPAAFGQGDNYSIQGSSYVEVKDNLSIGGITLGFSVFADSIRGCFGVMFEGNTAVNSGSAAYSIQVTGGGMNINDVSFLDNMAVDPGLSTGAGDGATFAGIYAGGGGNVDGVLCDGNKVRSFTGNMLNGIKYVPGVTSKVTGANLIRGNTGLAVDNP